MSTEEQRKERIPHFLKTMDLWEKREDAAGTLSKGMQQKLAITRALIHDPQLLFMDEPTVNLDPEAAKSVRDIIVDLKKQGKTIFLNTHNLDEAQRICDRIGILNTSLRAMGTPGELESSTAGRATVVKLEQVSEAILKALRKLQLEDVKVEDNKIIIPVNDPDKENPSILETIFRAGGRIQTVNVTGSTLEDAYMKLVREKEQH